MRSGSPGLLNGLFRNVASYMSPGTATEANRELCKMLDEDASSADAAAVTNTDTVSTAGDDPSKLYQEEHLARLNAESDAQDSARRLTVAQEQLAEYASQKEMDTAALLRQAQVLEGAIHKALTSTAATDVTPETLRAQVAKLRQTIEDAATEAKAFALQQKADVERMKRSSDQANITPNGDIASDAKRLRDGASGATAASVEPGKAQPADQSASQDNSLVSEPSTHTDRGWDFTERCKYLPLRLSLEERRLLRLLEAALSVSEYTDKVDVMSWRSKTARIQAQIKDLCAILSGLVVAQNYKRGQQLIVDRSFKDNAEFFQDVFEIGRRYKIMNPDKMRSEYGKLMYMLMDSSDPAIQDLLEFKCVRPLRTVYAFLEERGGLGLLKDALLETATAEIVAGDRPRSEVQKDIKRKEKARAHLAQKYRSSKLSEEDILLCMYSISDNNSFLLFNRDPIDRMIVYLTDMFSPTQPEAGFSLAISGGCGGARLTHNHERQYMYVLQSLMLWREINHDMFKLWCLAEQDLLSETHLYRLTNTGQGLNRVQQAPSVGRAIHQVLAKCQQRLGHWVGSSVVHLGDHNVPNALMFIDKYTQVPRILNPVVLVLDILPKLYSDAALKRYIDQCFGGLAAARKHILVDFFRHAFDGSGADNFFDAGSCIDGRLTSAWNWCSKIEKKAYYHLFKVAGFVGFDGDFQR